MIKAFVLLCSLHRILSVYAAPQTEKNAYGDCWNKYYVPTSETPNFTTLTDYRGQHLDRRWNIQGGQIHLFQEVNDTVELAWTKFRTAIKVRKNVDKYLEQTWQFGGAVITITITVPGAVDQMWNLGGKWFHYVKTVPGAVTSEGNASAEDLAVYKREIDCWCEANRRFFPPEYCVIYNKI